MEVRPLCPKELPQLLELYRFLHQDGWLEDGPAARQIWEAIQSVPGYHILAAVEGGEVLSSCTSLIVPNLTHGGPALWGGGECGDPPGLSGPGLCHRLS